MERINKIEYYLGIADAVSKRSTCLRRMYGAVIVKNDEIVATGYNGAPRGCDNCIETGICEREKLGVPKGERYELCKAVHAEQNAIISASRQEMLGATMYIAGLEAESKERADFHPCMICDKLIQNSGIERVIGRDKEGKLHILYYGEMRDDMIVPEDNERWAQYNEKFDTLFMKRALENIGQSHELRDIDHALTLNGMKTRMQFNTPLVLRTVKSRGHSLEDRALLDVDLDNLELSDLGTNEIEDRIDVTPVETRRVDLNAVARDTDDECKPANKANEKVQLAEIEEFKEGLGAEDLIMYALIAEHNEGVSLSELLDEVRLRLTSEEDTDRLNLERKLTWAKAADWGLKELVRSASMFGKMQETLREAHEHREKRRK